MSLRHVTRALVFLFVVSSAAANAGTVVFGPRSYAYTAGSPQHFSDTISVDPSSRCDGKAAFVLRVESSGISSARVSLNGVVVRSESDFSASGALLAELPAALNDTNQLAVELQGGQKGGWLVVSVVREIEQQPGLERRYTLTANELTFTENLTTAGGPYAVYVSSSAKSGSLQLDGTELVSAKDLASGTLIRRAVTLAATSALRLTLKGKPGDSATITFKQILDESACGPHIRIDTPAEQATITTPVMTVTGTVTGTGDEGVSVNGLPAILERNHAGTDADPLRWVAQPAVSDGAVTLTATVVTAAGQTASAIRNVTFAPDPAAMTLRASRNDVMTGDAVSFELIGIPAGASLIEADLDGDGVFELSQPSATLPRTTYSTTGLRHVTVRATTAGGATSLADAWINVEDIVTIDHILRARWSAFVDAFARNDSAAAAELMVPGHSRARYQDAIERLRPHLPEIAQEMTAIDTVYVGADYARYLITRHENGQDFGYSIFFLRCSDGVWRIAQF
ncbi:MAG TPA: hypothetical protein VII75_12465 [Thermoanaerobaculia bacterium]|nr:hypothetical protein [Thermoanaerobaculia bacterium]